MRVFWQMLREMGWFSADMACELFNHGEVVRVW